MGERIIRLSELMAYHEVKEVYKDSVACFRMDNSLVNIDTIPPVFADMFSFLLLSRELQCSLLIAVSAASGVATCCCFLPVRWWQSRARATILWLCICCVSAVFSSTCCRLLMPISLIRSFFVAQRRPYFI